jgi:sulfur-oxidizing protein SoxX
MKRFFLTPLFLLLLFLVACDFGPNSGRGFSLPEGSVEAGRITFVELECNTCHSVGDIERVSGQERPDFNVLLGGPVTAVKTYGDLVTSVINPSHKIARRYTSQDADTGDDESKMVVYNDVMTVHQLVDLVTFLEGNYQLTPVNRTTYPRYRLKAD